MDNFDDSEIIYYDDGTLPTSPVGASDSENDESFISNYSVTSGNNPLQVIAQATDLFHDVMKRRDWKPILRHKSGVEVQSIKLDGSKRPLFKGEKVFKGWKKEAILQIIKQKSLWDDWHEEGRVLDQLNAETSVQYMAMEPQIMSAKPRDFVVVEQITHNPTDIVVISRSVSPNQPISVPGRIREHIALAAWKLTSVNDTDTHVTYMFHSSVKGWIPGGLTNRVLSRRPIVMKRIEWYLDNKGIPPTSVSLKSTSTERLGSVQEEEMVESETVEETVHLVTAEETVPPAMERAISATLSVKSTNSSTVDLPKINIPEFKAPPPPLYSPPPVPNHRHSEAQRLAHELYERILPLENNGWNFYMEKEGVRVYTKDTPGRAMPAVRGEARIVGYTKEEMWAVVGTPEFRKIWDDKFDGAIIHEQLDNHAFIVQSMIKGQFPVAGRDLCLVLDLYSDPTKNVLENVAASVVDSTVPVTSKKVRAFLDISGWTLRESSEDGVPVLDVTYIAQIDLNGSIPSSILKAVLPQGPLCLARVREFLERRGVPPHLVYDDTDMEGVRLISQTYNVDTFKFEAEGKGTGWVAGRAGSLAKKNYKLTVVGEVEGIYQYKEDGFRAKLVGTPVKMILEPIKGDNQVILNGRSYTLLQEHPPTSESPLVQEPILIKAPVAIKLPNVPGLRATTPEPLALPNVPGLRASTPEPLKSPSVRSLSPMLMDPQHRFASVIEAAHMRIKSFSTKQHWQNVGESKGIVTYKRQVDGRVLPMMRCEGKIEGFYPEEILAFIKSNECRKICKLATLLIYNTCLGDDRFENAKIVETLDARTTLIHLTTKGTFPISPRDYSLVAETRVDLNTGALDYVSTSVVDASIPDNPDAYVRGHVDVSAWIFAHKMDKKGNPITDVVNVTGMDLSGNVPSNAIKTFMQQTPLYIQKVRDLLTKIPTPPYLARSNINLIREKFDTVNVIWYAEFEVDKQKLVAGAEVRLCERKVGSVKGYENGWSLTIEPKSVQVIRIKGGFRIVLKGGERAFVKVERANGYSVNGQPKDIEDSTKTTQVASLAAQQELRRRSAVPSEISSKRNSIASQILMTPKTPKTVSFPDVSDKESEKETSTRHQRHRSSTVPSLPVKLIRWQRLTDSQVLFMCVVAFMFFYMGMFYERWVLNGLLKNW